MANNSLITQEQYQSDMENLYNNKIKPYLNGSTHTGFTPVGTVISYFGETAPTHFLICDGTAYNKADYPQLWTHLSSLTDTTPYVVDGDNTKFKVPDLRGEFLRGTGTNSHTNQGSGGDVGEHQDGTETASAYISGDTFTQKFKQSDGFVYKTDSLITYSTGSDSRNNSSAASASGSYTTYTTRPTNTSVLFCIAVKDIYIDYALDGFPCEITNPQDKQGLTFDATSQKWVNGAGGLHEYSTTEKVVGTWIDGRPVYEKTFYQETLTNGTWNKFPSQGDALDNVDRTIDIRGVVWSSTLNCEVPINYTIINDTTCVSNYNKTENKVALYLNRNNTSWSDAYVIIQYTKTTDTPTVQS